MTTKRTTIIRAPRSSEHPYFVCRRACAQDDRLTWEARGVLWYVLSKPDDWEIQETDLSQHCGRDKVRKILKELEKYGYLTREHTRTKTKIGDTRYGKVVFEVSEVPVQFTETQSTGNQTTGNQLTGNPTHTEREEISTDQEIEQITQSDKDPIEGAPPQASESTDDPTPEPKKPTAQQAMFGALCEVWKYDPTTMTKSKKKDVGKVAGELVGAGAAPADVPAFYAWCVAKKWPDFTIHVFPTRWDDFRVECNGKLTAPLQAFTPDPHCEKCGGVGYLHPEDFRGNLDTSVKVPCSACLRKGGTNGQLARAS